jgi:hypothetical protein
MQELFEYYFIGVIFTMGPGSPSGKGPAGQGVGSGSVTGSGSGSGTTDPLNTSSSASSTFSFGTLDDLLAKLNRQIQMGVHGISEEDALKNLDKSVDKLMKWDLIVVNDIEKKATKLQDFNPFLKRHETIELAEIVDTMRKNRIDPGKKHFSIEEYANIQKKLVTSNRENHYRILSLYDNLVPRIQNTEIREELASLVKIQKENIEFKLDVKLKMLEEIKEKSKILREVSEKNKK